MAFFLSSVKSTMQKALPFFLFFFVLFVVVVVLLLLLRFLYEIRRKKREKNCSVLCCGFVAFWHLVAVVAPVLFEPLFWFWLCHSGNSVGKNNNNAPVNRVLCAAYCFANIGF